MRGLNTGSIIMTDAIHQIKIIEEVTKHGRVIIDQKK